MIKLGTTDITGIMLGDTEIVAAYLGTDVVYQNSHYDAEIEYLQSNEVSGFKIVSNKEFPVQSTFELKYKLDNTFTSAQRPAFFSRYTDVSRTPSVFVGPSSGGFLCNTRDTNGVERNLLNVSMRNTDLHTLIVDFENKKITLDGVQSNFANSFTQYTKPSRICLFSSAGNGGLYGKIYYFKISKNNKLLLDLIPVRIEDVGYMYDKVSKQILSNTEEGVFILGPDVTE